MARNNNKPDVYKGRRKKLNVLGIVLSAVVVLIVALFVLFGAFQKYIVYSNNGISLELPILATPGAEEEEGERVFEQVNAELEITDPDYSDIESQIDEEMEPLRAIFVPAENVNTEGITPYVDKLNSIGGNALVLEVKPSSGQLVWATSVQLAADYGTAGTTDLRGLRPGNGPYDGEHRRALLGHPGHDLPAQRPLGPVRSEPQRLRQAL